MGYNPYKRLKIIKNNLKSSGYVRDIPIKTFAYFLMYSEGMKQETARKWIKTFCEMNLITLNDNKINFKEE